MKNTEFDVVIVGAGMVGQAIAIGLAQGNSKLSIALVDPAIAEQAPNMGSELNDYDRRVVALSAQSQALLQRLGAWEKLPTERLSPYTAMQVWDGEGTGQVGFDAADLHVPALGHIVENRQVVWALQQCVNALGHIQQFKQAAKYIDNRQDDGRTPLMLADGSVLNAQLIIGADGALSRIRQWAGLPSLEWDYNHHAIVATVRTEQPHQRTAWQRFRQQGPLAFLPLADPHLLSIVWSTSPNEAQEVLALSDVEFNATLSQAFEQRLGAVLESSPKVSIVLRQRHAYIYGCAGILLAGDAAHVIHPLAGQGVNLGFKDVEVLVEEVLNAYQQGQHLSDQSLLLRYQGRRQPDNLATMATMEGFKRLFESDQPMLRLLRNQGMNWFNQLLPLKQHVMMQAMGLK